MQAEQRVQKDQIAFSVPLQVKEVAGAQQLMGPAGMVDQAVAVDLAVEQQALVQVDKVTMVVLAGRAVLFSQRVAAAAQELLGKQDNHKSAAREAMAAVLLLQGQR